VGAGLRGNQRINKMPFVEIQLDLRERIKSPIFIGTHPKEDGKCALLARVVLTQNLTDSNRTFRRGMQVASGTLRIVPPTLTVMSCTTPRERRNQMVSPMVSPRVTERIDSPRMFASLVIKAPVVGPFAIGGFTGLCD
jgi:hypothetical protein